MSLQLSVIVSATPFFGLHASEQHSSTSPFHVAWLQYFSLTALAQVYPFQTDFELRHWSGVWAAGVGDGSGAFGAGTGAGASTGAVEAGVEASGLHAFEQHASTSPLHFAWLQYFSLTALAQVYPFQPDVDERH